ncbi:MAG TPA: hypothetical protein VM238_17870 [Phycisphaerae bacterium]|nr:hypothetical protein [Phycisphaerae bacterium]
MKWKPDWPQARANLVKWWNREGLALALTCPRAEPVEPVHEPPAPADLQARWTDPAYRCDRAEWEMVHRRHLAEAFPYFSTQIGPGSLGTFLGAEPHFAETTVWYEPCIEDPDSFGPIRFDPSGNRWWQVHLAIIEEGVRRAGGRYLVSQPDLIENIDTLAAMRGNERLLFDLVDRPAWVHARLAETNEAFFAAFDLIQEKVRDSGGGNSFLFDIWGPGKTCKVQCDFSCMISAAMFREFVVPYLAEQCDWLDYSLYHLDGVRAAHHLDALLGIESLDAIEFTPEPDVPRGGSPHWYDLYRAIKAGGKSVQAIGVRPGEVIPLIEAVGPEGLMIVCHADDEPSAERLVEQVEAYR